MYKVFNGKQWLNFETYQLLVNWLSQFNIYRGKRVDYNRFLAQVGNSDKDTFRHVERKRTGKFFFIDGITYPWYETIISYNTRNYRVLDEDGKSIYDRFLIKDVLNHHFDGNYSHYNSNRKIHYYARWMILPDSAWPEFRNGPVPFVSSHHYGHVYRRIRTTNERRQTCNKESEPFNRARRAYNLPSCWDDIARDWRDSGWKSQGKHRHQWENGVEQRIKHNSGKHIYVSRTKDKRHIENDWIDELDDADFGSDLE